MQCTVLVRVCVCLVDSILVAQSINTYSTREMFLVHCIYIFLRSIVVKMLVLLIINRHFLILDSLTWDIRIRHEEIHNINRN